MEGLEGQDHRKFFRGGRGNEKKIDGKSSWKIKKGFQSYCELVSKWNKITNIFSINIVNVILTIVLNWMWEYLLKVQEMFKSYFIFEKRKVII